MAERWKASWRLTILTALLCVVVVVWLEELHFLRKLGNPAESVPPALAVIATVLVALVATGIRHLTGRRGSLRRPLFFMYAAFLIAAPVAGICLVQRFLILLTVFFRRVTSQLDTILYAQREIVPRWWVPHDNARVINPMYEGAQLGLGPAGLEAWAFPLSAWIVPVLVWTAFFSVVFFTMFCLMNLLRRQWVDRERLVFPLAELPIRLAGGTGDTPLWETQAFWIGAIISSLLYAFMIVNWHLKLVEDFRLGVNFTAGLRKPPWSALALPPDLGFQLCFTVLAVAFMIKQEINFSILFFLVLIKGSQVAFLAVGFSEAYPNRDQLGNILLGGFIGLCGMSLWLARRHLASVFRQACGFCAQPHPPPPAEGETVASRLRGNDEGAGRGGNDHDAAQQQWHAAADEEALSLGTPFWGFCGGVLAMGSFCIASGMSLQASFTVLAIILVCAITTARIRAESGAPNAWIMPWAGIPWVTSLMALMGAGFYRANDYILMSIMGIFGVGFFPILAATQLEALKIADGVGIRRRSMAVALHIGCVVGLLTGFLVCLALFYRYGADTIADFETNCLGFPVWDTRNALESMSSNPAPAPGTRTWVVVGVSLVIGLVGLRSIWLRSPLHPLGLVVLLTYGGRWMLGSVLVAWILKKLVLKFGGVKVLRVLTPFFLGLAVGELSLIGLWYLLSHFFTGQLYAFIWG